MSDSKLYDGRKTEITKKKSSRNAYHGEMVHAQIKIKTKIPTKILCLQFISEERFSNEMHVKAVISLSA